MRQSIIYVGLDVARPPGKMGALTHIDSGIETIGRARYASEIEAVTEAAELMHGDRASVRQHRLDSLRLVEDTPENHPQAG